MVVQRMLSGSTHCSRTPSTSARRCARRVTRPSVSTGTSSGKSTRATLAGQPFVGKPLSLSAWTEGSGDRTGGPTVNGVLANIALVVVFVLIGSLFAAAEMSLVSLRDSQVRAMSGRGRRGEAVARLAKDPNRFLAAVQVGVTLAGFLSASVGGATLSG